MSRDLFEYHPVIGYRFIPHLKARVRHEGGGYLVRTNNLGFRQDQDVHPSPATGTKRVLVFGDSYTAGDGVSNGHRYTDIIQQQLDGVEILNFGLPGSGTDQQYLGYREYAKELSADLLVIAPMVENIVRNPVSHRLTMSSTNGKLVRRAKPYYRLDGERLILNHSPVPKSVVEVENESNGSDPSDGMLQRLAAAADDRIPGLRAWTQRLRGITWPPEYDRDDNPAWLLMRQILLQWSAETSVPVAICPIPTFGHIEGGIRAEPYLERFAHLAKTANAALIDPLPAFSALSHEQRMACRFPNDEHPNRRGHEVLAQAIGSEIEKLLNSPDPQST